REPHGSLRVARRACRWESGGSSDPSLRVDGLGGHPLDAGAELAKPLIDALVTAIDLADVADLAAALCAEGGKQHGHAGTDVGRLDALAAQPPGAGDDGTVRVTHDDVGAHEDQLIGEDQAVLEHPLVHEDGP